MTLDGIRVVEIGQNLAGPVAGEILAHLGADVVKVERPEGDDARRWGPPFWKDTSPGFLAVNANKRSIVVDLKDREAVEWLTALIGDSDVVLQNLRPGAIDELGLGWLKGHYASFSTSGVIPERHRTGSHRVVPFESFETATGPIIVAAGNDRLFAKLAKVLGRPEWASDPRYATNAARVANKPALLAEIAKIFATASRDEWIARLEAEGVPCAVINTLPDAATTKQADALGIVQTPPGAGYTLIGLPLSFDGARPQIRRAPPQPGEHTDEVRRERGGGGARPRRAPAAPAGRCPSPPSGAPRSSRPSPASRRRRR